MEPKRWWGIGLNQQSYDLGAATEAEMTGDPARAARRTIAALERHFALVMVAERMEESLVLLAHQLCLPLCQVASLRKNARKKEVKVGFFSPLCAS